METGPWLVAGLGNPGPDALRREEPFREERRFEGWVARLPEAWLLKPATFMNLSGVAVRAVSDFYRIPRERVLVVLDDAALPLGRLRLRPGGSAGSHNGLASVLTHFAAEDVPRLRIGVGAPPPPVSLHDHVLGRFTAGEDDLLGEILERAAGAIRHVLKNGLAAAMNEFNKEGL